MIKQIQNLPLKRLIKLAVFIGLLFSLTLTARPGTALYSDIDEEIENLNLQIRNQKKQLESIKLQQQEYQNKIQLVQKDRVSLTNQLAILENRLAKAQLDIESANLEIDKTNLEIKKVEIDSVNLDKKIEEQKEHISTLLRLVYKQDQVSTLEMLLLNDSLAEFLNQAQYLEDTNRELGDSVDELKDDKSLLDQNKLTLSKKNEELAALKVKLEEKKSDLTYEQANKNYVLEETRSSEKEYQSLLQRAKRDQQQAESDIASAEQLIRKKMSEKDQSRLNSGNNTIAWPVTKNTIVATFHDPDYPYRNIIGEHSAVDIRAKQGTTIKAAADGYVAKVKFDGTKNYAYIMIIHGNGLATVYGHTSAVYVSADQYVVQGQAIGRSGGTPGGIGSGGFSTGPHLHFEVRLNGLPVDPENYLP